MLGILIALHVLVCILLIFIILIQPGKGYGLSETFGGQTQTIFGVRAGTLLTRITAILATIFLLGSLSIAIISGKRSRSLVERIIKEETKETKKESVLDEKAPSEESSKGESALPLQTEETSLPAQ